MRIERLSFFVKSVRAVPAGWRLEGEPGYHRRHWARPGDRFDRACGEHGGHERNVDLAVVELSESHAIVTGSGGDQLRPDDILSGERPAEHDAPEPSTDRRTGVDLTETLAGLLGLPAPEGAPTGRSNWSAVESELGVTLPRDYKRFTDTYGAGLIDDHVTVCGPDEPRDWADLVQHNAWAHECVRVDFGGPDNASGAWRLGDSSQWDPQRDDVPSWFDPGDNLISWGHTGNGDLLFWHVKPGADPNDWPVVFKEEGPYWEQYQASFSAALVGLLTGEIQSDYLSRWLGGPHSYTS
ncbi:SMI1/KNR4 family protein [Micromonospora sp. DT228]|uniref:SMI1/KNR4 family protein n=1 Tax=Micromonospora sp. DT228 TaxID=3393443 RepID=UPI003CEC0798